MKQKLCALLALWLLVPLARGMAQFPAPHEIPVESLEQKLFPLLEAIDDDPSVSSAWRAASSVDTIRKARTAAAERAVTHCDIDSKCLNAAFELVPEDRATILETLGEAYRQNASVKGTADRLVCESPDYPLDKHLGCERSFVKAINDELTGVSNVIEIFGDGKPSSRGAVDVAEYDTQSVAYRQTLNALAHDVLDAAGPLPGVFQRDVLYACYLLIANRSAYATQFPALDSVDNQGAALALQSVIWSRYKYSAILVPGLGPEIAGVPLSAGGRARLRLAVNRYLDGLAPVIIVSGGSVHPPHTEFNEAVEMKRALVQDFGIPSDAVVIEPFARRTTTNLRNTARLLVRYGIGLERPVLVTTDIFQTSSITSGQIADRCLNTLGYVPFRIVEQVSPVDTSVQLKSESLQFDPRDPLDP